MARSSASNASSKSYRRRAAKLARMIAYYVEFVRAPVGNDIAKAPSAKELKQALHLMLDTTEVDSKGRLVRDTTQDTNTSSLLS